MSILYIYIKSILCRVKDLALIVKGIIIVNSETLIKNIWCDMAKSVLKTATLFLDCLRD